MCVHVFMFIYLYVFVCAFMRVYVFVCLDFTSHRHSIGPFATFQLYWWRKTSGALPCIISGPNGHSSRTTDVPSASSIGVCFFSMYICMYECMYVRMILNVKLLLQMYVSDGHIYK
jgi:hypothetical protein